MRLKDKIAIITGGSSGIGEAICHAYAKEGATVIVVNKNNPQEGVKVADAIKRSGGKAEAVVCDVANPEQVMHLIQQVMARHGRIDIVVNNAGVLVIKSLEEHTLADWDLLMDVNLKGPFLLSRAVAPIMKQQKYGKMIFVSSVAAVIGHAGIVGYCATKGGILAMAKSLVAELAPFGINVNLLSPGYTATAINQQTWSDPEAVKAIAAKTPSGVAFMKPQDMSGAAVYLASDDSRMVHGLDLLVDNGLSVI